MGTNEVMQTDAGLRPADYAAPAQTSPVTNGNTVGSPKLSEAGKKYYEELKKKYSNMEFVLVSEDMKDAVRANAANYARPNRMVVLIDTAKVERMAVDEDYRRQYEAVIQNSAAKFRQFTVKMSKSVMAPSVKSLGLLFDDGGNASFFAVIDKSLALQRKRIKKGAQKKAEEKKKADKKAQEERAEELRDERKGSGSRIDDEQDTIMVKASTLEELFRKIEDVGYLLRCDSVQTEDEKKLGQHINYSA